DQQQRTPRQHVGSAAADRPQRLPGAGGLGRLGHPDRPAQLPLRPFGGGGGRDRGAAAAAVGGGCRGGRPVGRPGHHRRARRRAHPLRPGPPSPHPGASAGARHLGARAAGPGVGRRPPGARRVPGDAGDGRARRWGAGTAPARRRRPRPALPGRRLLRSGAGGHAGALAGPGAGRSRLAGQLPPPPGRPCPPGAGGLRARRRRHRRGAGGPAAGVLAGRPVAPRARRRRRPLPRPGPGGHAFPGRL
ncbi:MAG: COG2071: predicted glutamine amidotransferases in hypothetical Actinobacterial gene cluster, partial [uncultured Friedmanniella sp.]